MGVLQKRDRISTLPLQRDPDWQHRIHKPQTTVPKGKNVDPDQLIDDSVDLCLSLASPDRSRHVTPSASFRTCQTPKYYIRDVLTPDVTDCLLIQILAID